MSSSIIKTYDLARQEEKKYIADIKSGKIVPIDTGYEFINSRMLSGLNDADVVQISGSTGTGKTAFVMEMAVNIVTKNPNVRLLYGSFELPARKLISRIVSRKSKKTLKELYAKDTDLSLYDVDVNLPIDFLELSENIPRLEQTFNDYAKMYPNDRIGFIIDHTVLLDNLSGDNDMDTIRNLALMVNKTKRIGRRFYILINQFNDAMYSSNRFLSKAGHYPIFTDIYGPRAASWASELVIALVNPSRLNLPNLGGKNSTGVTYGLHDLPLYIPTTQGICEYVYAHTLKARDGDIGINPLVNQLKYSNLIEIKGEQLSKFYAKYNLSNE